MQLNNKIKFESDSIYSIGSSFFSIFATLIIYYFIYLQLGNQNLTSWVIIISILNFPQIIDFISGDSLSKIIAKGKNKNILLNASFYLILIFYSLITILYFFIVSLNLIKLDFIQEYKYLLYFNIILIGFCKLDSFILDGIKKIKYKSIISFIGHFFFLVMILFFLKDDNFYIIIYSYTFQNFFNFIFFRMYILRKYPLSIMKISKDKKIFKDIIYQGAIFNFQKITKDIHEPIIKFFLISLNYTNNILFYDFAMKVIKSFDLLIYSFSRPYNYLFSKQSSIYKLKELLVLINRIMFIILLILITGFVLLYSMLALAEIYNFQYELKNFTGLMLIIFSTYSLSLFFYPINFYIQIKKTLRHNIQGNIITLFSSIVLIMIFDLGLALMIAFLIGNFFTIYLNLRLLNVNYKVSFRVLFGNYFLFLVIIIFGIIIIENLL